MLKCDVVEPEEQTITRFLGGLKKCISDVIRLQPYWTFNDVRKLAISVEQQQRDQQGSSNLRPNAPLKGLQPSKTEGKSDKPTIVKAVATPDSAVELPLTAENVENVLDEVRLYLIADGGNVALHEIDGNIG
ncbi:hypothetical protein LWI29_021459 [Acer saccharum]|uniref:Uncharacterized protein n=1 Tax=Acer saccharum TaxID=4024 RepID=A0AA39VTG7_ACESA|nr:hypothetical protein LWI29_021459 [Acer saccharum]